MDAWDALYKAVSLLVLFNKSDVVMSVLSICPGMVLLYFEDLLWFVLGFLLTGLPEMKVSDTFIWSFDWCH